MCHKELLSVDIALPEQSSCEKWPEHVKQQQKQQQHWLYLWLSVTFEGFAKLN